MISIDSSKNRAGGSSGKGGKSSGTGTFPDESGALWDHVTQDVKPLKKSKTTVSTPPAQKVASKTASAKRAALPLMPLPVKKPMRAPGDQEVDRRTDQKLKRGQYPVDLTLDLHGLTQDVAHTKLLDTLRRGQARGLRCVLVITGKGRGEGQGVLRRKVPTWLSESSLHDVVLRFHAAQPEHGGAGALYVLLRRKRTG